GRRFESCPRYAKKPRSGGVFSWAMGSVAPAKVPIGFRLAPVLATAQRFTDLRFPHSCSPGWLLRDYDQDLQVLVRGLGEVVLDASRVLNVPFRVIYEAHQYAGVRVRAVVQDVLAELFADLTVAEVRSRHLHLDCDLLAFEQEVHPRGGPGVGGRDLLGADVLGVQPEDHVHEILDVVLVGDLEARAPAPAVLQGAGAW